MKNRGMLCLIAPLLLTTAFRAVGQIDTARTAPEQDLGDLYARASASHSVLIGRVVKSEGVMNRLSRALVEKMKVSLDEAVGGSLYTVRVERTICSQTYFNLDAFATHQVPASQDASVYIFTPRDQPEFVDGYRKPILLLHQRYLLFVTRPKPEQAKEWVKSFQLDRKRAYSGTEEGSRGVVELKAPSNSGPAPEQPPVLDGATRLCQAMRPLNPEDKLAALKKLDTADPAFQKEIEVAIHVIKAHIGSKSLDKQR